MNDPFQISITVVSEGPTDNMGYAIVFKRGNVVGNVEAYTEDRERAISRATDMFSALRWAGMNVKLDTTRA